MKNYTDYPEIIGKSDTYQTDASIPKSSIASVLFFWRLYKVVRNANKHTQINTYDRYNWVASSLGVLRAAESIGIKVQVKGMKHFTEFDGPAIIIGNHMSTLETLLLPSFIQPIKSVIYVIKKQLIDFPLFGPVAAARHPIIVGRTNPREDLKIVMEEGTKNLEKGRSIIIFPQKTRSAQFDKTSFNSLGIKLAKKNNVPVIPLALVTDAWGNGKIVKELGKIDADKRVYFEFGKPIKVEGSGSDQHEEVLNFIETKLKEWGRSDLLKQ
ncbi:MAG: 1-acyl-sn-glycerol-3-phosphate acyltransferase [Ignavibacteriae bacterium]|nr:1-acyl-sn-glycerol-3-phosphate acyltransferase [Ignavibacteriota bacterium]MCB9206658.1 1-acyl-sn-glycerol-3-phosphate acyltransferase [Ignavibacteriales bacterium]MCB9210636.1 1-acyl-sn-glycerol-3-phosphate acyltransferase [Ignavibacteriales bacterium]MCB9218762.1 1-acyl-sn-glycerol-3-phosphate acyltransferase [Ignavibacteriales bacterium]MCB9259234.1 1-acyl-sn-glycerol-3-phosphate acyltransferase [Ignavibacteriales bacterium]